MDKHSLKVKFNVDDRRQKVQFDCDFVLIERLSPIIIRQHQNETSKSFVTALVYLVKSILNQTSDKFA